MGYWTPAIQAYAVGYLIDNGGLPLYGAAGLVSRWMNVEAAQGPTSVNPSSGAFGIAQWLGARKPPISGNINLDAQLAYVLQELNGVERASAAYVFAADDADSGAVGASAYERAEGSKQLYPRDNYTNRTAAGIPAVVANYQDNGGSVENVTPAPIQQQGNGLPPLPSSTQSSLLPFLLIGVAGLVAYLLID